jgi:hypothetical protein
MSDADPIPCRVAACRDDPDGESWTFFLINDGPVAFPLVQLDEVSYEWGDTGNTETAHVRLTNLAPGAHARIWTDDGDGVEFRMDLSLRITAAGREHRLLFEFPRLYRKRDLPIVPGLGKPGWVVSAGRPG